MRQHGRQWFAHWHGCGFGMQWVAGWRSHGMQLVAGWVVMGCSWLLAGAVMGHSGLLAGGFVGSCGAMDGDSDSDLIDLATVGLVLVLFIILAFFVILLILLILVILLILLVILASSVGWLGSLEIGLVLMCQMRWDDSAGSSNSGGAEVLWRGNAHTTVNQFLFSPKIIIINSFLFGKDGRRCVL